MTREEAISVLKVLASFQGVIEYLEQHSVSVQDACNMAIQALSQEPKYVNIAKDLIDDEEDSIFYQEPCDDAISRDAVLSIIDGWYEQNRETENIEDLIILITYMDSVTPKSRECEDVISRAEVKRIVDFYKEQYDGIYHINESIDNLPSVTQKSDTGKYRKEAKRWKNKWLKSQKSGEWIRVTDKTGHLVWECDKCGWQQRFNTNFCPDCGAKMESEG